MKLNAISEHLKSIKKIEISNKVELVQNRYKKKKNIEKTP